MNMYGVKVVVEEVMVEEVEYYKGSKRKWLIPEIRAKVAGSRQGSFNFSKRLPSF